MRSFSRIRPRRPQAARQGTRPADNVAAAENLLGAITACLAQVQAAGYAQTAEILAIARLDLLARLHGFSDAELEAVVALAAGGAGPEGAAAGAANPPVKVKKAPAGR